VVLRRHKDRRQGFNGNRGTGAGSQNQGRRGARGTDQGLGKSACPTVGTGGSFRGHKTRHRAATVPFDIQVDTDVRVSVLEFELTGHKLDDSTFGGRRGRRGQGFGFGFGGRRSCLLHTGFRGNGTVCTVPGSGSEDERTEGRGRFWNWLCGGGSLASSPPAAPLTVRGRLRSLLKKKWSDAAGATKVKRTGVSLTSHVQGEKMKSSRDFEIS
jgi:hypothetical protein